MYPLLIYVNVQIGDVSGGHSSMKSHTLSQHDWDLKNGDVSCWNGFINIHTLSQCNESSYFNDVDGDVKNDVVSGGHGSMNRNNISQNNGLSLLINNNNSEDIDMNGNLKNGDVSCVIGLINRHTLSQCNESNQFNDMDGDEKGWCEWRNFFMNSNTISEAKNLSSIDSTNKKYGNITNVSEMEDTGFQDGVDIDDMSSASTLNQYVNMEFNNESNHPLINGTM